MRPRVLIVPCFADAQAAAHAGHERRDCDRPAAGALHLEAARGEPLRDRLRHAVAQSRDVRPSRDGVAVSTRHRASERRAPSPRTASKNQPSRGSATSAAS